jgi:hypothetical protein
MLAKQTASNVSGYSRLLFQHSIWILEAGCVVYSFAGVPNCIGPQVCSHAVFPSCAGVYQHCSCQLLQLPYFSFGVAVLVGRVDPGKQHALLVLSARLHPLVGFENAVIGVIVLDGNAMSFCECLKRFLALNRLFCRCCLLKIDKAKSTELIDKHSHIFVTLCCQEAGHLRDETGCRQHQLVHRYDMTRSLGCRTCLLTMSRGFSPPWASCCL